MPPTTMACGVVNDYRLHEIRLHMEQTQQHIRGVDGFEVPHYVLPISRDEAFSIVVEVLARRRAAGE